MSKRSSRASRTSRATPRAATDALPKQGEIWWASGSVEQAVLDAAASAGSAPLSGAMRRKLTDLCSAAHSMFSGGPFSDERTFLSRNGVHLKVRPCIVRRISDKLAPDGGLQVTAFVIATYGGTPITNLPDLTQHFAVSVGDTAPWPSPDATVIRPSPDYPKSRETPVYLIAHPIDIPLSAFVDKYALGPAEPGGKDRGPCTLSYQQQFLLDDVVEERLMAYKGKPFRELIAWNDSWEVHNRERQKQFSGTGPAASVNAGTSNAASERSVASRVRFSTDQTNRAPGPRGDGHHPRRNAPPPIRLPGQAPPGPAIPSPRQSQGCAPPPPRLAPPPRSPGTALQVSPVGAQWSAPQGFRIHTSHGWAPQIAPNQVVLVPTPAGYLGDGQYVDPRYQQSYGYAQPHPQPHPAMGYQVQHQQQVPQMQYPQMIRPAQASPTSAYFEQQQQQQQQQYSVPPTPHAPSTFQAPAQYAQPGYDQYHQFHPTAYGMHQGSQMVVVTQENISYMPPQLVTRAHGALMCAPEMIDATAG